MDTDTFDLQEIKRMGQSFYVLIVSIFNHCHLFIFRHYKWQSLEIGSSYSQIFAMETWTV